MMDSFRTRASCLVLEGEKHEKTAQQLTEIMNNYVALYSSATTDSPTDAKGIYIISYFAGSGGTGGVGLNYKDTYYDVATKNLRSNAWNKLMERL